MPEPFGGVGNPATVKGTGAGGAVKVENKEDIEWMRKLAERDYVADRPEYPCTQYPCGVFRPDHQGSRYRRPCRSCS